jgi:subtilisin
VKVLDANGRAHTSWVLNGLAWCRRNGMDIANLSLGSREDTHDPGTYSRAYERAAKSLRDDGILAVAAAGNDASFVGNPARCPSFMAVSSIDCRRRRSSFSNFGPQVEVCAPGSAVRSTYPPTQYRTLSGTSMATPHVAGVAALVKQRHPAMGGDAIRVHLWRTALDLGSPGRDWHFGFGQVDARRAVR